MIDGIAMAMEKPSVATTVVSKDTSPAIARRIDHHREEESFEDPGQARLREIKAESVEDDFDHAPRVGSDARRRKKHFRRPNGGRPPEELNTNISTDKPEENSTLGIDNLGRTEPDHATLLPVPGRFCARPDNSLNSGVHVLVICGARSHFMSMQRGRDFPSTKSHTQETS